MSFVDYLLLVTINCILQAGIVYYGIRTYFIAKRSYLNRMMKDSYEHDLEEEERGLHG